MEDDAVREAREKLKAKFASNGQIGGKGSVRRKKQPVHKAASTDDKRLNTTLKRLGVNSIPGIEEVNIFKEDGNVIHFENPKVQASIGANTYVVSGTAQNKSMSEMLPSILNSAAGLKQLQEAMARGGKGGAAGLESLLAGLSAGGAGDKDDSMPELEEEEDFEKVAAESK